MIHNSKIVFFGSSDFSVYVLNELKYIGILPTLIVTTPDKPKGRKLVLTPTPVKIWAEENNIQCIDPASLKSDSESGKQTILKLKSLNSKVFLVASYGKIIPKEIFEIPEKKTLNIHPSLLPKYRGASPIQSQILNNEKDIGVSIMQIDEEMDHGPIVIQKIVENIEHPVSKIDLEKKLAIEGAKIFAEILPNWLENKIETKPQKEDVATYCKKIKKSDGEIKINIKELPNGNEAFQDLLKIKAFVNWPTTYFFIEKNKKQIRVVITDATIEDGVLKILKVIPEGKKEMYFEDFLRGFNK